MTNTMQAEQNEVTFTPGNKLPTPWFSGWTKILPLKV